MKYILLITTTVLSLSSCKKERTCSCFNPGGKFETAFTKKTTLKKAKEECEDYGRQYDSPDYFSETFCELD